LPERLELLSDPSRLRLGRRRHLTALLGTPAARLGTTLTVVGLVPRTLIPAGVADFGAKATEFASELRAPAHERRRSPADLGTIAVEPDAFGHHCYVGFTQTGVGTMFASLGAFDTGRDAGRILFVGHLNSPGDCLIHGKGKTARDQAATAIPRDERPDGGEGGLLGAVT
jgi:hypothetical protein